MREEDRGWMAYVDGEVRAACVAKGWGSQIRRKWSVREKPVMESSLEDYEWKLIPDAEGRLPDAQAPDGIDEGMYYVLSYDKLAQRFVLQHDNSTSFFFQLERTTCTEIRVYVVVEARLPRTGWLRDHLLELTTRFRPNTFSVS